jgi:hypothetical protein
MRTDLLTIWLHARYSAHLLAARRITSAAIGLAESPVWGEMSRPPAGCVGGFLPPADCEVGFLLVHPFSFLVLIGISNNYFCV